MNKVILVTGASRGIGRAIAKDLALDGNMVIANYNHSKDKAEFQLTVGNHTIVASDRAGNQKTLTLEVTRRIKTK